MQYNVDIMLETFIVSENRIILSVMLGNVQTIELICGSTYNRLFVVFYHCLDELNALYFMSLLSERFIVAEILMHVILSKDISLKCLYLLLCLEFGTISIFWMSHKCYMCLAVLLLCES